MWNLADYSHRFEGVRLPSGEPAPLRGYACAGEHTCGMSLLEQVIGGKVPKPVARDSRICFGIAFFSDMDAAVRYDKWVRLMGRTFNGGYFDGMACGRAAEWDKVDPVQGQLYAVTE